MIRNSRRGPVWGLVIAGLIIGSAVYLWGGSIFEDIVKAAPALIMPLIPSWMLLLVAPVTLFAITLMYFIYSTREADIREPDVVSYTQDIIFNIDWSWIWFPPTVHGNHYTLKNLTPYCPSCSALLTINDYNNELISCPNERCNWKWDMPPQLRISNAAELDANVRAEIDRRVHDKMRN